MVTTVGGVAEVRKVRSEVEPEPPPPSKRRKVDVSMMRPAHVAACVVIGADSRGGKVGIRDAGGGNAAAIAAAARLDTVRPKCTYHQEPMGSYPTPPADLAAAGVEPLGIKSGNLVGGSVRGAGPGTPDEEAGPGGCGF